MGCFQVFEDHEGIEADILRRLAGLGGRPEARSAGQRPALLVVSPRAALRGPIAAACRTALLPGDPPLPELELQAGQRRQLWRRPPQHPHHLQPDRGPALGGPSAGAGHRPGTGGGAAGVPLGVSLPGPPPRRRWQWPGPFCCWGSPRSSSPPPPSKILSLRLTNLPV